MYWRRQFYIKYDRSLKAARMLEKLRESSSEHASTPGYWPVLLRYTPIYIYICIYVAMLVHSIYIAVSVSTSNTVTIHWKRPLLRGQDVGWRHRGYWKFIDRCLILRAGKLFRRQDIHLIGFFKFFKIYLSSNIHSRLSVIKQFNFNT